MADQEGFVRRWSRRKSAAREQTREPEPAADAPSSEPVAAAPEARVPATPAPAEAEPAVDLEALPDIESLTYESDFTAFMRKGVPAELRRRALQRLWRSDPVLANLDGLVEYGEDYTKIGTVKSVVRTAYRVGRGMLREADERAAAEADHPSEPAAGTPGAPTATAPATEAAADDAAAVADDHAATPRPDAETG